MTRIAYGLYPQALPADHAAIKARDWLWLIYLALITVLLLWPDYAELKIGGKTVSQNDSALSEVWTALPNIDRQA